MKKSYFFALAALALAGCANDSFDGPEAPKAAEPGAIAFGPSTNNTSRADGATAAGLLNNEFVVEGIKTMEDNSTQLVFNDYTVQYKGESSELGTLSNTKGWEYVGIGGQTIKYWDPSATSYTFVAYSKGDQAEGSTLTVSPIDNTKIGSNAADNAAFKFNGTFAELGKCYVSKVTIVDHNNFANTASSDPIAKQYAVSMEFKKTLSTVRIGFYEVIPGYGVKDIKFYSAEEPASSPVDNAQLSSANAQFSAPAATAEMKVSYPNITDDSGDNYLEPVVSINQTSADAKVKDLDLSSRIGTSATELIGTSNPTATMSGDQGVTPMAAGTLKIKVDYTLKSEDTDETIQIKGATAKIPATFTDWKPNYAYTYIFKITDKSSNYPDPDDPDPDDPQTPLYPITFDAVVVEQGEGNQHTITIIENPSITTYQQGTTNSNEYVTGKAIYALFEGGSPSSTNVHLYTIVNATTNASAITSESECINAYKDTDKTYNGIKLVEAAGGTFSTSTSIPMADGTTKENVTALTFTPSAAANYAIIYNDGTNVVCKVVMVVAAS